MFSAFLGYQVIVTRHPDRANFPIPGTWPTEGSFDLYLIMFSLWLWRIFTHLTEDCSVDEGWLFWCLGVVFNVLLVMCPLLSSRLYSNLSELLNADVPWILSLPGHRHMTPWQGKCTSTYCGIVQYLRDYLSVCGSRDSSRTWLSSVAYLKIGLSSGLLE